MPKVQVVIDPDIDFGVVAWVEAFGIQLAVGVRKKKVNRGSGLSNETTVELSTEDYTDSDSE